MCLRESLRIVNIRYQRGITNELDVALATRELDTLQAQIAPLDAQVNAAQYTLAVLLGEYPENIVHELSNPNLVPSMPAPVAAGVPLDLLKRRPDIQQAERELAGATARIGVATADLFPHVALIGGIGSQGQVRDRSASRKPYMVVRSGRCLAAARLRRAGCQGGYRPFGRACQPGELSQDDLECRSGSGHRTRCVSRLNRTG